MRPPAIIVSLVHIQGPLKGEIQDLAQETIRIGRHPSNDVRLPADLTIVSRNHAEIHREGNRFRLVDKSANGTFVNGKKVTETFLRDGDVIEFADGGPKVSFLTRMTEAQPYEELTDAYAAPPGPTLPPPREPPQPGIERSVPPFQTRPTEPEVHRREPTPSYAPPPSRREESYAQPVNEAERFNEIAVQKTTVPLVIQYGPTVRSYKEVPVTIGRNPKCGFVLDHKGILDEHAQVFYRQNQYWVKDLTGQTIVRVNMRPIPLQIALAVNDVVSLAPTGPTFRFVGEGRLAEVEEPFPPLPEGESKESRKSSEAGHDIADGDRLKGSVFSRVKRKLF